jgi:hypothetical protein
MCTGIVGCEALDLIDSFGLQYRYPRCRITKAQGIHSVILKRNRLDFLRSGARSLLILLA